MRARTYIYMLALVALALQGCREGEHPSNPNEELYAISMAAPTVVGTRALYTDDNPMAEFAVYGYKEGNVSQMVFTGDKVSKGREGWTYSPTRYWDRIAHYYFAAYAPATAPTGFTYAHNKATRTLTLTAPQWQTIDGSEADLLVATSQGPATTYLRNDGEVELTFDHVYAQLVVRVVRGASLLNTYKLTSITYSNVPTADGTATYTLDYTTPASSAWSDVESDASKNAYSNADGEVINSNPEDTPTAKHLVVPFTSSDEVQVTVGYIVNDRLAQMGTASTGISQLEAGKRYVLTLSLGSGAVIEPSLDIEQWVEVQDEQDIEVEEDDKHNW